MSCWTNQIRKYTLLKKFKVKCMFTTLNILIINKKTLVLFRNVQPVFMFPFFKFNSLLLLSKSLNSFFTIISTKIIKNKLMLNKLFKKPYFLFCF